MVIVARGPLCWGSGQTVSDAMKHCAANWPASTSRKPTLVNMHIVLLTDVQFTVDACDGSLSYNGECYTLQTPKVQRAIAEKVLASR